MAIQTILVTGANGQLGWELGQSAKSYPTFKFVMVDRSQLDFSNFDGIQDNLETGPKALRKETQLVQINIKQILLLDKKLITNIQASIKVFLLLIFGGPHSNSKKLNYL